MVSLKWNNTVVSVFLKVLFSDFPWKAAWRTKTPTKISFFVWTAAWGKILTLDNPIKRVLVVVIL